jgi:hypothetical protein
VLKQAARRQIVLLHHISYPDVYAPWGTPRLARPSMSRPWLPSIPTPTLHFAIHRRARTRRRSISYQQQGEKAPLTVLAGHNEALETRGKLPSGG